MTRAAAGPGTGVETLLHWVAEGTRAFEDAPSPLRAGSPQGHLPVLPRWL